jgi:hypothetical protein
LLILPSPAYKQKHHNNNQGNDCNGYPHWFHEYLLLEVAATFENYSTAGKEKIDYYQGKTSGCMLTRNKNYLQSCQLASPVPPGFDLKHRNELVGIGNG